MFIHVKSQFLEKNQVLSIEKFLSLVLLRNVIMLLAPPHYPIHALLSVKWVLKAG